MTIQLTTKALRERLPQNLQQVLNSGSFIEFELISEIAACLRPLLEALEWRGDSRDIAEALPHHVDDLSLTGFRNSMAHLGYSSRPVRTSLRKLDPRNTPCLFVPQSGSPLVVVRVEESDALVFDSGSRRTHHAARGNQPGVAYVFRRASQTSSKSALPAGRISWIVSLLGRYGSQWRSLIGVTVGSNVLALAVPLFTLVLYDSIIPSGSLSTLAMLAAGIALVLAFEIGFLFLRGNILAFVGARIDLLISSTVFKRLLELAPVQIEHAPLGTQIARVRDMHAVSSIFTGPVCLAILDLPFVLLFLTAVLLVGGWLVLVPLGAAALYALAALALHKRFKGRLPSAAQSTADYRSFLVETATKSRAIKQSGLDEVWTRRHRQLSARATMDGYALIRLANFTGVFAEVLKLAAGVATLAFGILAVIDNQLSVGALIASMALVWRTLSPFQVLFLAAIRLEQARNSVQAIDALMAIDPERQSGLPTRSRKSFAGRIAFSHVSFRFRPDRDPAVFGLNFEAHPGELIAVAGPSGAGKSTTLKLILGMYTPQLGSIHIDGLNLRQLDPVQLRQSIAYLPHIAQFFHGTVAQNLRLAHPIATDSELAEAALEAQVFDEIMALPQGFDTWLDNDRLKNMPDGLRQRLALARVFVRKSPILLLDEAGQGLDREGDQALIEAMRRRKGQTTIVMVTHRPSHIRLADRVLLYERGMIRASGPAEKILPMLREQGR